MSSMARHAAASSIAAALAVFVASLVVFDRAASAGLDRVSRWAEGRWDARATLAALGDKPAYQVLVLGTSRTFEAVHPSAIERALGVKAYKEAGKGKGLRYAWEFYRAYREVVARPKLVVYGVDYFMFGNPSDPGLLDRFPRSGAGPARRSPLRTLARKEANDRAILRILEGAQRRIVSAMDDFNPEHDPADMAAYTGKAESRVVARPEPARYQRVAFPRFPGAEGEFLVRLLRLCAEDGATVVFLYPPDYVATRRTNHEHDLFRAELERVIDDTPRTFLFDYDDPARFPVADPSLFWDGDYGNPNSHLSRKGAEVFGHVYLPDLVRVFRSAR